MYGFVLIIYFYFQNVVYKNVLFLKIKTIFYLRKVICIIYSVVAEILIKLALITNQSIKRIVYTNVIDLGNWLIVTVEKLL
jgi:hypothetical protein